jgi:ankyrin repeat protein
MWIDDDDVSIPDGVTIFTPPATMVFPPHNRVIRTDNLPWYLFNQEFESQIILQKALSESTSFMTGRVLDNLAHSIHDPRLASPKTFHAQQDLVPSSIFTTTSGLDNIILDLGNMFDPLPDVSLSWVNASPNSMPIDPENPTSLTSLLQRATAGYFGTSLESIYKTYIVVDNRVGPYTALNLNTHSNPTAYQLFSLLIFLVTNNLSYMEPVQMIYEWAKSNSCIWILTEILKSKSTTIDVFATKLFPVAVRVSDGEMVRNLVSRNVDIDTPIESAWSRKYFRTALSLAVGQRNMKMIKVLLALGATPTVLGIDSMEVKATRASLWSPENIEILRLLLNHGANPECLILNEPRGYPLIKAASEGSLEAVSLLLGIGADVNLGNRELRGTALQASVVGGHVQVVRALLKAEANVNKVYIDDSVVIDSTRAAFFRYFHEFQTPIQLAASENHTEIALLLLQSGALTNFCPVLAIGLGWIDRQFAFWEKVSSIAHETLPFAFAIQYAAQNNNVLLVHQLLAAGAMVDSRIGIEHGDTPLQIAARLGNVELVSLLLAYGADVNAAPSKYNGRTAIQAAAESGSIEIIQMLINAGANIHASPGWRGGRTALQAALEKGHINAARCLLLAGADINAKPASSHGLTALQAAVSFGDIEIVKELLSYGAEVSAPAEPEKGLTALQAAVRHKNIELLNLLLEAGADVNALPSKFYNMTALQCAASNNWLEGVRLLLDYNADLRMLPPYDHAATVYSALGWAICNHNYDMIALLFDHGADPNDLAMNRKDEHPTAFLYALSHLDSYEILDLFVKRGADIDKCWGSRSALDVAIQEPANVEVVRMMLNLISQTTNNPCDNRIRKSLAWISVDDLLPEDIELLQLLLEAGADINAKNPDSETTILQRLVSYGFSGYVEFLLQNGAEVNTPATKEFGTPLQEAINSEEIETADLLLDHGADVNAPPAERYGITALQAAAIHGYLPLALKLLERGADVTAEASPVDGRTAIDGAAEHGHLDMLQLLLNAYGDREGLGSVCDQAASFAEKEGHAAIAVWLRGYAASRSTSFYSAN